MGFLHRFCLRPSLKEKLKDDSDRRDDHKSSSCSSSPAKPEEEEASSSSGTAAAQDSDYKCRIFSYRELATATNNFSYFLGKGGFGSVYKGQLEDGKEIAVKVHDNNQYNGQGIKEFLNELLWLSVLDHENLVHLFGYCADPNHTLLVYKYMPLGSLDKHISGQEALDWIRGMKIALGAAKGLKYLHHEAEGKPCVIHRDMKSANILLDNEYNPKLSDFGLARFDPTGDKSYVPTKPEGTPGYCAPEYAKKRKLTLKCDIYSYGVVFLELITGRKALMDPCDCVYSQSPSLVDWARLLFSRGQINQIVDPRLLRKGDVSQTVLKRTLELAIKCVEEEAKNRPVISEVVEALEDIVATSTKQKMQRSNGFGRGGGDMVKAKTSRSTKTLEVIIEEEKEEEETMAVQRKREVHKAFSWAQKAKRWSKSTYPSTTNPPKSLSK